MNTFPSLSQSRGECLATSGEFGEQQRMLCLKRWGEKKGVGCLLHGYSGVGEGGRGGYDLSDQPALQR